VSVHTRPTASRRQGTLSVVVAADEILVAESVLFALSERAHDAMVLRWPGPSPARPGQPTGPRPDVGLLISELDRPSRIHSARKVIASQDVPWVVLTSAPRGPTWGAVLETGATLILPTTTTLDELSALLDDVAADPEASRTRRASALVRSWHELTHERAETAGRIRTLTPHEEDVLSLLYVGASVRTISELSGTTIATVRGHVQSVLRKLGVNSQIAAVAAYQSLLEDSTAPLPTRFSDGPRGRSGSAERPPYHWV
jgi:DNA-binding NarL/FixJ family response regulator